MKDTAVFALLHKTWETLPDGLHWLKSLIENDEGEFLKNASGNELRSHYSNIPAQYIDKWIKERFKADFDKIDKYMDRNGIRMVNICEENFPESIRNVAQPPVILYYKGSLSMNSFRLGIVGSRKGDHYGLSAAYDIAKGLSEEGICVVSGLARGIDSYAHKGALEMPGGTMAILGCGLDKVYPPENRYLADQILAHPNGSIISEFPLGSAFAPWHFPLRNRIISGFSTGVIVVQATNKSGVYSTVESALNQGKDVFAVPGEINNPLSAGPNQFIQEGAHLVRNYLDILNWYHIPQKTRKRRTTNTKKLSQDILLTEEEKIVLSVLSSEMVSLEAISEKTCLPVNIVTSTLSMLEIYELVKQLPGRYYCRI